MIRLIFCDTDSMSEEATLGIYERTPALAGVVPSCRGKGSYDSIRGYIALLALTAEALGSGKISSMTRAEKPESNEKDAENKDAISRSENEWIYDLTLERDKDGENKDEISRGENEWSYDLTLERGKDGKPKFSSLPIFFNISHRGGAVAIILSDEGEVGVDIEEPIDEKRASGIEARFLKGFSPEDGRITEVELIYASMSKCGKIEMMKKLECSDDIPKSDTPIKCAENADYDNNNLQILRISPSLDVTSRWTALEAVIKLSGGGFADFPRVKTLTKNSRIGSYRIFYRDKEYSVSLALPKF